jgi:hypothetical protein
LKIEPWIINGWQSYNKYNGHMGLGGQLRWAAKPWLNVIANQYGYGEDNVGLPHRTRYHTDDSVELKYYDKPKIDNGVDRDGVHLHRRFGMRDRPGRELQRQSRRI